jgi:small subunit ribosomal protein S2
LRDLEQGQAEGTFEFFTKKEKLLLDREREKLDRNLSGLKNMSRLPGALFVVDAKKERIAVAEANKLGLPVVAIVDTNADPDVITVPIAGNDDAIRSVSLIAGAIAEAIQEARAQRPVREEAEEGEFGAYSSDAGPVEGGEGGDADKKKRRPRRKRRPKPEAIVHARIKADEGAPAAAPAPEEAAS